MGYNRTFGERLGNFVKERVIERVVGKMGNLGIHVELWERWGFWGRKRIVEGTGNF